MAIQWDDFKVLLALSRGGSVAAAARELEVDNSTVSRRLAALEVALDAQLLIRGGREFSWTDAGRAAVGSAEAMEAAVTAAMGSPSASETVGDITIAEGLAPAALSSTEICPAASSLGVPSSSTLTLSCFPAASAPLKTHCQYSEVVAFTITAMWSSARTSGIPIRLNAATEAAITDLLHIMFSPFYCAL